METSQKTQLLLEATHPQTIHWTPLLPVYLARIPLSLFSITCKYIKVSLISFFQPCHFLVRTPLFVHHRSVVPDGI